MEAEPVEQIDDVGGESYADGHVGAGVFEDQVPADDPGDEFTHGGVSVCICGAGDGNHGCQLGITEAGERADKGYENQGDGDRGTGAGTASQRCVGDEVIRQRRVDDAGGVELLAGDGGADNREDARSNDGADAESRKRPGAEGLFQGVLGHFRVADQFVDRFAGEQLAGQASSPHPVDCWALSMRASDDWGYVARFRMPSPQCTG